MTGNYNNCNFNLHELYTIALYLLVYNMKTCTLFSDFYIKSIFYNSLKHNYYTLSMWMLKQINVKQTSSHTRLIYSSNLTTYGVIFTMLQENEKI